MTHRLAVLCLAGCQIQITGDCRTEVQTTGPQVRNFLSAAQPVISPEACPQLVTPVKQSKPELTLSGGLLFGKICQSLFQVIHTLPRNIFRTRLVIENLN